MITAIAIAQALPTRGHVATALCVLFTPRVIGRQQDRHEAGATPWSVVKSVGWITKSMTAGDLMIIIAVVING